MPSHSSSPHPTRTPRRSRRTLCSLLKKAPRKMAMPSRPARAHLLPEPSRSARSQKNWTISLQTPSHSSLRHPSRTPCPSSSTTDLFYPSRAVLPDLQRLIISLQMPSHSLPDLQKLIISLPLLTKSHLLADDKSLAPLPSSSKTGSWSHFSPDWIFKAVVRVIASF